MFAVRCATADVPVNLPVPATWTPSASTVNVTEPLPAALSSMPTSAVNEVHSPPTSITTELTELVPRPLG